jgi:hypothetical protein
MENVKLKVLCKGKKAYTSNNLEEEFTSFNCHLSTHPITKNQSWECICVDTICSHLTGYLQSGRSIMASKKSPSDANQQPSSHNKPADNTKSFPSSNPKRMHQYLLALLPLLDNYDSHQTVHIPQSELSSEQEALENELRHLLRVIWITSCSSKNMHYAVAHLYG